MLKILVISVGLLMASAGQASAPPSPRGGRKPSPSEAPASTPAAATVTPPNIDGSASAPPPAEPAAPAAAPAEAPAKSAKVSPRKTPKRSKPRDRAEREQLLESAGVERSTTPTIDSSASAPIPPSLSSTALRQELAAGRGPAGAPSEREKMETLSADLARARAALQAETARLEALLKKPGGAAAGEAPAGDGTMPVGDPLAATRPTAPPAAANQVDVVSKALKGMKPEQAAAIIGHLNRGLAADVLQKMRPADAGLILGYLKPELAAALATEIANREPPKGKAGDKVKP